MSLTQTTTTTRVESRVEVLSDLQRRLQPQVPTLTMSSASPGQLRFRGATLTGGQGLGQSATNSTGIASKANNHATLARRFSFVWPFISKENAPAGPFLRSRCSQLLRHFPAFLGGRQDQSTGSVRDLISRVLTQLKAVWLVLAVYMSLLVLTCLCSAVLYTFLLAKKPPGLWFLVACVAATGAIAVVSFSARERPQRPKQQPLLVLPPQQQQRVDSH